MHNEEGLILDEATLAAATADDYYFPLGYQAGVGVADVLGTWRDALIKRCILKGTDDDLGILGIWHNDSSGGQHWLIGPVATAGMRYAANDTGEITIEIDRLIRDVRNVVIRVVNTNGSTAKKHSVILIYEPIR
jgi:hypothetical protein